MQNTDILNWDYRAYLTLTSKEVYGVLGEELAEGWAELKELQ